MAIFKKTTGAKKTKAVKDTAAVSVLPVFSPAAIKKHTGEIVLSPRITEKASDLAAENVYAFNVSKKSNKKEIARAIKEIYGVTPEKIRTVHIMHKQVVSRSTNRTGRTASGKKAYVHLKAGDKIEII